MCWLLLTFTLRPDHTHFWSLLALYSLLTASLCVTFADAIKSVLKKLINWLAKKLNGETLLPVKWRNTGIFSSDLKDPAKPVWEWLSNWKDKWHGRSVMNVLGMFIASFVLMFLLSFVIPAEQVVANQTTTRFNLCLPHVSEELDQYHFYIDSDCNPKTRAFTTFCQSGLKPPWNEGQTITWMRFRVEPDCLVLLGYDGARDSTPEHKIINW